MRQERKSPEYALFCKQREVQSWYEKEWACGFASLMTCMRFLGERGIRGDELVSTFRKMGGKPKDGLTSDEVCSLARRRGYGARLYGGGLSANRFKGWLRNAFSRMHPTVVAVEPEHFMVVYSNHEDSHEVWCMDPLEDDEIFELISWDNLIELAEPEDFEAVEILPKKRPDAAIIPPSSALFQFFDAVEDDDDEQEDFITSILVDNFLDTVTSFAGRGRSAVLVTDILEPRGALQQELDRYEAYWDDDAKAVLELFRETLYDIEAYREDMIRRDCVDKLVADTVPYLILLNERFGERIHPEWL